MTRKWGRENQYMQYISVHAALLYSWVAALWVMGDAVRRRWSFSEAAISGFGGRNDVRLTLLKEKV